MYNFQIHCMRTAKSFVWVNYFFLAFAILNIVYLSTGTQFWFDRSEDLYEWYLWYSDTAWFVWLLFLIPLFLNLVWLFRLGLSRLLLTANVALLLLPVVSYVLLTTSCSLVRTNSFLYRAFV